MSIHTPAHKHVGDAGKPGQIINPLPGRIYHCDSAESAQKLRDLMYQHGISPFNPAQKQAKTLKDTL
jgi:hypothetical protein